MLHCLGCNFPTDGTHPTRNFGGNLSVILDVQNSVVDLSKMHITISFHTIYEAIASKIIAAYWLKGDTI